MKIKVNCYDSNMNNLVRKEIDFKKLKMLLITSEHVDNLVIEPLKRLGELRADLIEYDNTFAIGVKIDGRLIYYKIFEDERLTLVGDMIHELIVDIE